ncbi:MAG: ARMT1-like domain-containing protein [Desulfonauticus sp.]|nr:ARMT1-like domain-containing protein [Desulfonauticus sp.]
MLKISNIHSVRDLYYGKDPLLDAWILNFMTENDVDPLANPEDNASFEQIKFMVDLDEDQVFAPCTDWLLLNLLKGNLSQDLKKEYLFVWKRLVLLLNNMSLDDYLKKKLVNLWRYKFKQAYNNLILIPSRLTKRLITILLSQCVIFDPYEVRKQWFNQQAYNFIQSRVFEEFINLCPADQMHCNSLANLRWTLDMLELSRLFYLSFIDTIWKRPEDQNLISMSHFAEYEQEFEKVKQALEGISGRDREKKLKILYLPDSAGSFVFDLLIVKVFLRLGHKVIMALKKGFYFDYPTFWDIDNDKILQKMLKNAYFIAEQNISKKDLLQKLKENDFVIISDGTRERLNLCRSSVTFARSWKESDLIIAKGYGNYRRLILTSHLFTRDIIACYKDELGKIHFEFKKKSSRVRKITEDELIAKAENIKNMMLKAKANGKKVMFYSAIVGSIPGQTKVAIEVLNTFVNYLRSKLDGIFIINPAEHFEPGMDGDDLMYMWEMVQRSGLIDIWRFQTVADIEKSFELMGQKVPPAWVGKDATFSTGCTKEMQIALEEQKKYPEMQIIGPSSDKFFRRREYGVGKYFDASLVKLVNV